MEQTLEILGRPTPSRPQDFETTVGAFVDELIRSVATEMRWQPASMVYEIMRVSVERRLPGVDVEQEQLRDAAARISAGVPVSGSGPCTPT
jgi:hypothetical protein